MLRAAVIGIGFAIAVGLAIRMRLGEPDHAPVFYAMIILLMCYMLPNAQVHRVQAGL